MSGIIDTITGDGARRAQARQEQQQAVASARQLSTAASESSRQGLVRRNARGRQLLANAKASDLPSTVA